MLYLIKTGCQWRMIPRDFPPYNTVYYYFRKWKKEGVFEDMIDTLREKVRVSMRRETLRASASWTLEALRRLTMLTATGE